MNSPTDVWKSVLSILSGELTPTAVNTWFDDCSAVSIADNELVLHTPSEFKKNIISNRFAGYIQAAMSEIFSSEFKIVIMDDDDMKAADMSKKAASPFPGSSGYTFERFVVGNSNKFAHAAARAVAESPGKAYNPLFLYGDSGLGKTHLLYAIGNALKKTFPNLNIIYIKSEEFTNELIAAIQAGKNIEFRQKYRSADLFLMDDVQFIAGKESTEEEFFHTFNTLYEAEKQIVLTSDRPPKDILRLEDRLKTRFEWGLIADIQPPDYETRVAIIKNKAEQLGFVMPEDVCSYIAENITANIRQIEGAVKKVIAHKDLMESPITVNSASRAIKDMFKENSDMVPTADIIISETAKYYSLEAKDLKGNRRTRNTALARHVSMYLIRRFTNLSLKDIGREFDGKDHTTVLNSLRKIEEKLAQSPEFADTIKDITANINARNS